jgi:hypothetical protein
MGVRAALDDDDDDDDDDRPTCDAPLPLATPVMSMSASSAARLVANSTLTLAYLVQSGSAYTNADIARSMTGCLPSPRVGKADTMYHTRSDGVIGVRLETSREPGATMSVDFFAVAIGRSLVARDKRG